MILKIKTTLQGKKDKTNYQVKDLLEAVKILNNYVDEYNLKASDMDCGFGEVYLEGKLICEISYNGMVINMEKRLK